MSEETVNVADFSESLRATCVLTGAATFMRSSNPRSAACADTRNTHRSLLSSSQHLLLSSATDQLDTSIRRDGSHG